MPPSTDRGLQLLVRIQINADLYGMFVGWLVRMNAGMFHVLICTRRSRWSIRSFAIVNYSQQYGLAVYMVMPLFQSPVLDE